MGAGGGGGGVIINWYYSVNISKIAKWPPSLTIKHDFEPHLIYGYYSSSIYDDCKFILIKCS